MGENGISRKRRELLVDKKKVLIWDYYDPKGNFISDKKTIDRCNKLVLPPAWETVWICSDPKANLQATGKDAKGRLQYRYHENWTAAQSAKKFDGMTGFADILPSIRKKVDSDLKLDGMPRDRVVALVVKLID